MPLIPAMTNDPKDRHVLAAAVRSGASVIVTANLKDFPSDALAPFDVEAVHPDDFLCDQFDLDPKAVFDCMFVMAARNKFPPRTLGELLQSLERLTPRFVASVRAELIAPDDVPGDDPVLAAASMPELTDEQIGALSPDLREAYTRLLRWIQPSACASSGTRSS